MFDNPGLFSNFTYVKMKGPNKQLSNQMHYIAALVEAPLKKISKLQEQY